MKVMLVVPPQTSYLGASAHKALDERREPRPWLGIFSIATSLQQACPSVELRLLDCLARDLTLADLQRETLEFQPDLVGLTCLTFTYHDCLRSAAAIKKIRPQTKVCVGGFHATLFPAETLAQDVVDFVVVGEGERTFVELVNSLDRADGDFAAIAGLAYKRDGQQRLNPAREVVAALDAIPHPDYECADIRRYSHVLGHGVNLALESSRGCPFQCTFCDVRKTKFRYRSPAVILDAMERLYAKGVRSFFFVDDNFTVNKRRAIEFCDGVLARGLKNIDFKVSSRVDTVDEELMTHLKAIGCSRISLGVESSQQRHLDFLKKGVSVAQIVKTLETANRVGLPVFAYVILGFPGQTRKEMLEEVKFVKRHHVEYASFSVLTVYPKTELYRQCLADGALKSDPWPEFVRNPERGIEAPIINGKYDKKELETIQLEATRKFYFSPRVLWHRIREVGTWGDFTRRAKIALRFLKRG
jgi:anaerobic magnesium-protoporphyrin IX monomethyl ester cyclase